MVLACEGGRGWRDLTTWVISAESAVAVSSLPAGCIHLRCLRWPQHAVSTNDQSMIKSIPVMVLTADCEAMSVLHAPGTILHSTAGGAQVGGVVVRELMVAFDPLWRCASGAIDSMDGV